MVNGMGKTFHNVTVTRHQVLTPGMVRLTFAGEELADFRPTGIGDEYLRLFFPNEETGEVVLPIIDGQGNWSYQDGKPPVRCATYTVRRFDAGGREIDIDFVVHEGGVASEWAQKARPGDPMIINNPRGLYAPPEDIAWQLLMCDATGLPALARILEETPRHVTTRLIIEVVGPQDQQALPFHPGATVTWLHGGNGMAPSRLHEVMPALKLPPTPGYIWVAGEQKAVRTIRKYVRQDLKLPAERYKLVAYWIEKRQEWDAAWEALDPHVKQQIEAAWSSGRSEEEIRDEVDATLEKYQL